MTYMKSYLRKSSLEHGIVKKIRISRYDDDAPFAGDSAGLSAHELLP